PYKTPQTDGGIGAGFLCARRDSSSVEQFASKEFITTSDRRPKLSFFSILPRYSSLISENPTRSRILAPDCAYLFDHGCVRNSRRYFLTRCKRAAWVAESAATKRPVGRLPQSLPNRSVTTQPAPSQIARPAAKCTLFCISPSVIYAAR